VLDEAQTKFTIDPTSSPLKTSTFKNGNIWYDHALVGVSRFNLAVTWNPWHAGLHIALPANVPTSTDFEVEITSVC